MDSVATVIFLCSLEDAYRSNQPDMLSPSTNAFFANLHTSTGSVDFDNALSIWKAMQRVPYHRPARVSQEHYFDGLIEIYNVNTPTSVLTMRPRTPPALNSITDSPGLVPHPPADFLMRLPFVRALEPDYPATVGSLSGFNENLAIMSGGILDSIPWDNVVLAGGAVAACLTPIRVTGKEYEQKQSYFAQEYERADLDLFTFGLGDDEIRAKAKELEAQLSAETKRFIQVTETDYTFSFDAGMPWRTVQLVKFKYSSPADILSTFDLDAPCSLYTGSSVWSSPRALVAMCTLSNRVDLTRLGRAYETRVVKYALRGYSLYYPDLPSWYLEERVNIAEAVDQKLRGTSLLVAFHHWLAGCGSRDGVALCMSEYIRARNILHVEEYGPRDVFEDITEE